ncbi:bifunctional hydroxymethylpyrimidine kinase/phosphomethylpyrimidine kinase [Peribacillus deserti]|uniref:Hydroxymethylpyrimidine/phosphomethylpyrimidine kinase n=1 Tax=Peribacillus deserti TaxID=673318 RepID=A0A2N5M277_9BACI|nr:bifunctional hydroxymethylpyrimidine kinase/phosphomethylpyrimidine kinase [Peribacillus deserti]PLT28451.1 bifunctional hydroxymethylpyrimidine kinase/phosphomethylpyrimidine kinase [Peribacillus deserti]
MKKALTIAGSDSGGGAGIQADLKTFQELEVFGMSAITAVTAQNTLGVQGIYPMTPQAVENQIQSIGHDMGTDAVKLGMLFNADIIRVAAEQIKHFHWKNVILDPVMIAKGGASLLQQEAVTALRQDLFPLTTVLTPNIPEAEILTGMTIRTSDDKKEAAKRLLDTGVKQVVIKGGHDEDPHKSTDLFYDGSHFRLIQTPRISTKNTHGTGCTFSAAITAEIAKGMPAYSAVVKAKDFIQAAIENSLDIGAGHGPTNHWAYKKKQEQYS